MACPLGGNIGPRNDHLLMLSDVDGITRPPLGVLIPSFIQRGIDSYKMIA
jgi:hypothetical protein